MNPKLEKIEYVDMFQTVTESTLSKRQTDRSETFGES